MKEQISWWKILIVLLGFPFIYQLYSLSPIAVGLFRESNANYFIPFFVGAITLHFASFVVCYWFLKTARWSNSDIEYTLTTKQTLRLIGGYFAIAVILLVFIEAILSLNTINAKNLERIGDFFPKSTLQRIVFIVTAFSAGFCEEYVYRGFGIKSLESKGIPSWIALLITSVCFTFIHGVIVFKLFPFYLIPALFFGIILLLTKRLYIPMIIHSLIDLTAILEVLKALD